MLITLLFIFSLNGYLPLIYYSVHYMKYWYAPCFHFHCINLSGQSWCATLVFFTFSCSKIGIAMFAWIFLTVGCIDLGVYSSVTIFIGLTPSQSIVFSLCIVSLYASVVCYFFYLRTPPQNFDLCVVRARWSRHGRLLPLI